MTTALKISLAQASTETQDRTPVSGTTSLFARQLLHVTHASMVMSHKLATFVATVVAEAIEQMYNSDALSKRKTVNLPPTYLSVFHYLIFALPSFCQYLSGNIQLIHLVVVVLAFLKYH